MAITNFDKRDVEEAMCRLYAALDDHSPEGFADCFTAAGIFKSRYGSFEGRVAIADFIRHHIESGAEDGARHMLSNFIVDEEEGGAVIRCYLIKLRFDVRRVWIAGTSKLNAHLIRFDGKWLLQLFELQTALKQPQGPPN